MLQPRWTNNYQRALILIFHYRAVQLIFRFGDLLRWKQLQNKKWFRCDEQFIENTAFLFCPFFFSSLEIFKIIINKWNFVCLVHKYPNMTTDFLKLQRKCVFFFWIFYFIERLQSFPFFVKLERMQFSNLQLNRCITRRNLVNVIRNSF